MADLDVQDIDADRDSSDVHLRRADKKGRPPRVLIVDDHSSLAETLADGLKDHGYDPIPVSSGEEASRLLEAPPHARDHVDAVVTDLRMPGVDGLALLAISRQADPNRPVIVMTAFSAVDSAIESIRRGAYHYLTKPFKVDELVLFLDKALEEASLRRETVKLRRTLREQQQGLEGVIGSSAPMRTLADLVARVADATVPVLVVGETGSGKGVIARAIHAQGRRAGAPFVSINCAALPETLLEPELFGHVKGAFTGATSNRVGLFEEAHGGTIFLDEIAEIPAPLQAKLLHVLESGLVRAIGSNREQKVNVRVIAATHRNLRERVAAGAFREDLLYRLDVVTLAVPSLRERREDLPLLIEHFFSLAKQRHGRVHVERITPEAHQVLLDHSWPGNVRELEHVIERAVILAPGAEITVRDLPPSVTSVGVSAIEHRSDNTVLFFGDVRPIRDIQRRYAAWAFERLGGRKLLTAEKLGVDFKTLVRWLDAESASGQS